MTNTMAWRKDDRADVSGSLISDGCKGRYQILKMSDWEWILYLPSGDSHVCGKLSTAKLLASQRDAA